MLRILALAMTVLLVFNTEANEKGIIYGTGAWNIGDIKKLPVMQQAYDMGFKA